MAYAEKNVYNDVVGNDTLKWIYNVRDVKAGIKQSDSIFCVGDIITLEDSSYSADSITKREWAVNGDLSTGTTATRSFKTPGVYTFQLLVKTPYCANSVEKKVFVNSIPLPNFSFKFGGNCPGSPVPFTNKTDSSGAETVTYSWDFGDGEYSVAANPNHIYKKGGSYKVTLTAKGAPHCTKSLAKTISINARPIPKFSWANTCEGEKMVFTNESVIDSGYSIGLYAWKFGDGINGSVQHPAHKYASAGTYNVTLVTTSNNGCIDSVTQQVVVHPLPQADFTATSVCLGSSTQFSNKSTVSAGSIASYLWVIGTDTSTEENPAYTFASLGQHAVTLYIETAAGCIDSVTKSVTVYPLPNAKFSYSQSTNRIDFHPDSTGQDNYNWDFGDGNISTVESPSHLYTATGTYTVTLKVENADGCVKVMTKNVVISTIGIREKHSLNLHVTVFPNPFTKATTLEYELMGPAQVEGRLYDMHGREITVIVKNAKQAAGKYTYAISADKLHLKPGTYLIRLTIDGQVRDEQVIKLK
jgi:PKD repeat protein